MKSALDWKNEGNGFIKAKNYEEAVNAYTEAIKIDPKNHVFFSNRSLAYMSLNNFENALNDADECIKVNPNFAKGYLRKGFALFKLDKKEESLTSYEEGLKIDPNNVQLLKNKEAVEASIKGPLGGGFDMNKMGEMMNNPVVQKLMKENPQMVQTLLQNPNLLQNPQMMNMMMNMFNKEKGKQEGCPENNKESQPNPNSQFNPNQFNPNPNTTNTQTTPTPKPQEKKVDLQVKIDAEFAAMKKKADDAYRARNLEEAVKLYTECNTIDNSNLIVRNNKAACLIELKKIDEAMVVVDEAIKVYNETDFTKRHFEHLAKLLARKARIYHIKLDYDNAIKFYNKSLMEDKNRKVSMALRNLKNEKKKADVLAYLNPELAEEHRLKGNAFFKQAKFAEAIEEYEEGTKRNPKNAKCYNNLAACFMKMMRHNEALKNIEKTLELEPKNVKALVRKGTIHQVTKEYHKAMDCFKLVLEIDPQNLGAQRGIQSTQMKISMSMGSETDEERVKRSMSDPEINAIMRDPMVRIALEHMQKDPKNINEYLQDKTLGPKIQKLVHAGIIRMG